MQGAYGQSLPGRSPSYFLSFAHAFAKVPVLFADIFVLSWPDSLARFAHVELALLVGKGMLVATTSASDGVLRLETLLDRPQSCAAISAYEFCASTASLVVGQEAGGELKVAPVAALCAGIGRDISGTEASLCAAVAHCLAPAVNRVLQAYPVELVSVQ